jgi:hypothetical protein
VFVDKCKCDLISCLFTFDSEILFGRVGHIRQVAGNPRRVQWLFNDMDLYPTTNPQGEILYLLFHLALWWCYVERKSKKDWLTLNELKSILSQFTQLK